MKQEFCLTADEAASERVRLEISGAVQGVGFRPLVFRLAGAEGLGGFVRNTDAGVTLELEGASEAIAHFLSQLDRNIMPPASIHRLVRTSLPRAGDDQFVIRPSSASGSPSGLVLPDLAMCPACRAEISDPVDRRFLYPFTSCTNCGPRYSIIEAVPYDRERTSMRHFPMCAACRAEYADPASRRFHAETNACPDCGPQITVRASDGAAVSSGTAALNQAVDCLRNGGIVALKGLGGFQLLVDARNDAAVLRLRRRKHRPAKPLAIMAGSITQARAIAQLSRLEEELLQSPAAPIVLARSRGRAAEQLAPSLAPGNPDIGLMLPCTPLHHVLMDALGFPVVATSGNMGGEPLAFDDAGAFAQLSGIADLFLTHDRAIMRPVDDSVVREIAGQACVLRCARGYAPLALPDPEQTAPILALGGHLKNSVALSGAGRIVLGPHIGDLDSMGSRKRFAEAVGSMVQLYAEEPASCACDAHPDYHSTRLAEGMGLAVRKVPHHLAHVLAAMIDNNIGGPVLGTAWDGTGYAEDGTIRGSEFLAVDGSNHRRVAHLLAFPLPGGDAAIREPRRAAIGALHMIYGEDLWTLRDLAPVAAFEPQERRVLAAMLRRKVNTPLASSAGRLFDAVAAILGLSLQTSFEGEAAMALEFAAQQARANHILPPPTTAVFEGVLQIDWRPMLKSLTDAARQNTAPSVLAAAFHDWAARAIVHVARMTGIEQVALTGGCFQNVLLAELASEQLQAAGFQPFRHCRIPPNDGGLAVGQAAFTAREMHEGKA